MNPAEDEIALVRRLRGEAAELRRVIAPPRDEGSSCLSASTAVIPGVLPPDFLEGYTFVREIHLGGQGAVYEALQNATRRRVAIKLFHGIKSTSRAARRFEREAELITQLRHPNVVTVLDAGQRQGVYFLIMEYVDGRPIDAYFADRTRSAVSENKARSRARCRRETREMLELFAKVCDGVAAAHLKGIIHRDLKPANILIDAEGQPRVLDFGLAKLAGENSDSSARPSAADDRGEIAGTGIPSSSPSAADREPESDNSLPVADNITQTGQFVGSVRWASPEQAVGDNSNIDIRTDVYSLGVILYQLLTGGGFPYDVTGRTRDVLERILTEKPHSLRCANANSHPPTLPLDPDLEAVVGRCLSKTRDGRYQSADSLGTELRRYLSGFALQARQSERGYVLRKFVRRHWLPVCLAAAAVLATTVGGGLLIHLYQRLDRQARESNTALTLMNDLTGIEGRLDHIGENDTARQQLLVITSLSESIQFSDSFAESTLRMRLAQAWMWAPDASAAAAQALRALEAAQRIHPRMPDQIEKALEAAVWCVGHVDAERALVLCLELERTTKDIYGDTSIRYAESLAATAENYRALDNLAEFRARIDRAIAIHEAVEPGSGAVRLKTLAEHYCDQLNQLDISYDLHCIALTAVRPTNDDIGISHHLHSFGHLLIKMRRFDEAAAIMSECVERRSRAYGADDADVFYVFVSKSQYGEVLTELGRFHESEQLLRAALTGFHEPTAPKWRPARGQFERETLQRLLTLYSRWSQRSGDRHSVEIRDCQDRLGELDRTKSP
ncbi:MAG: serine/threonine protein kinase [Planctomycetes bacterium]|nr:serine/threonine protein kinase [Planctomycetota bacterium]